MAANASRRAGSTRGRAPYERGGHADARTTVIQSTGAGRGFRRRHRAPSVGSCPRSAQVSDRRRRVDARHRRARRLRAATPPCDQETTWCGLITTRATGSSPSVDRVDGRRRDEHAAQTADLGARERVAEGVLHAAAGTAHGATARRAASDRMTRPSAPVQRSPEPAHAPDWTLPRPAASTRPAVSSADLRQTSANSCSDASPDSTPRKPDSTFGRRGRRAGRGRTARRRPRATGSTSG